MSMWWYEIFLYAGWKFHFRLLITQCSKDDVFSINPSWIFLFFHPWLKTFTGAISVSLNVVQRQNKQTTTTKTHKKNVGWDKCQHYEITLLLLCQRQETRCRDAIWSKFVSSSRHVRNPQHSDSASQCLTVQDASVCSAHLLVRNLIQCECETSCSALRKGGGYSWGRNLALSQNTNNNPSMFLIRFAFYIDVHCVSAGDCRRDISLLLFLGGLITVAASHAGPEHTRSSCLVLLLTVFQVQFRTVAVAAVCHQQDLFGVVWACPWAAAISTRALW